MKTGYKFFLLTVLIIVFAFLLSGCIEGHMHVTFNIDGSADIEFMLLASTTMGLLEGEGMDLFANMKSDMIRDGFTIEDHRTSDKKGFIGKKKIDSIDELYDLTFLGDMEPPEVVITSGLFSDRYEISHDMKLTIPGMGNDGDALTKLLKSEMQFIVTFPIDPVSHNADRVSTDGKTIYWDITTEKEKPVNVVVNVPKLNIIIPTVIGFVFLVIIIILIVIKIGKKNKK